MYILSISENILLFISGFGILQAVFSACLLYFHPGSDRSVSAFLALYIACIPIPMFIPLVQYFLPYLGKVLAVKYRYLNKGYMIFMFGLIVSVLTYGISFFFSHPAY